MKLFTPGKTGPWPTAVDGDLCFKYVFDNPWHEAFTDNGFALAMFDRTELAHDIYGEDRSQSPLYEIYPEYTFGALGAWAWGYQRVTDALVLILQIVESKPFRAVEAPNPKLFRAAFDDGRVVDARRA